MSTLSGQGRNQIKTLESKQAKAQNMKIKYSTRRYIFGISYFVVVVYSIVWKCCFTYSHAWNGNKSINICRHLCWYKWFGLTIVCSIDTVTGLQATKRGGRGAPSSSTNRNSNMKQTWHVSTEFYAAINSQNNWQTSEETVFEYVGWKKVFGAYTCMGSAVWRRSKKLGKLTLL